MLVNKSNKDRDIQCGGKTNTYEIITQINAKSISEQWQMTIISCHENLINEQEDIIWFT